MNLVTRVIASRWSWFVQGLPSVPRACALFKVRRATMTKPHRCAVLWDQCQSVFRNGIPGSLVECGVWRGGSAAIMGLAARRAGEERDLHLFDSFEGLPEPSELDDKKAIEYSGGRGSGRLSSIDRCKAGVEEVQEFLFGRLRMDRSRVHFHVGWFQNTLPSVTPALGRIALLRLDGDWYESTAVCLRHLYPKVSTGGIIVLDDYFTWAGCKNATDEYRREHGIESPLHRIDDGAAYWIKDD